MTLRITKLLVLMAATLQVLSNSTLAAQQQRPASIVKVAKVKIAEIAPTVSVPGTVYSRDEAQIMASASGLLTEVLEPGTVVKKGDIVARIDRASLLLQRAEQQALLERAKISQGQLESDFQRQQELRGSNLVSEFQLEQTQANRDLAIADAKIIEVRIQQINNQLRQASAKAQFSGIIVERFHRSGEEVTRGTPLVRLLSTEKLEVRAFIPLKHMARTQIGDQLDISNSQEQMQGNIRVLIPSGDVRSQTFEARVDIATTDAKRIAVGQLVSVAIPIRSGSTSLAIPRDALVLRNNGSFVYRIGKDSVAERVAIELGDSAGDLIAVTGDLQEGDQVAIRGGETLSDGAKVEVQEG